MEYDIVKILDNLSFEETLRSFDVKFLDECRIIYEEKEEYERCALLRDRIKDIINANNNISPVFK